MVEHRRHQRTPIDLPLEFTESGSSERVAGRAKDLSLGGMYVQTARPSAFGVEIVVYAVFPGRRSTLSVPAVVRWVRAGEGMGVQFGLMGARETHAITEMMRAT